MKQQYSAALYMRLSRDDYGAGDSGSIQTQQMMLERYCEEQRMHIHDCYIDDGFSGLNFERPSFQRMLSDNKNGMVNLVITKDLSRLGRDYIQTGYYTELFFPQHSVRYIALNDGVDTLHDNNDIAPFKNILNDMYARDLSRKVKSAKRARAMQGAFIGSHAPYGYRQSDNNCNQLEIDEDAAHVVCRIFHLALSGMGAVSIAKLLREEKILTPAAYKVQKGSRHFTHLYSNGTRDKEYRWAYTTVQRILRDRVYLGDMINHKSQVEHYKTKIRKTVPQSQQIVVENTHPALIGRSEFEKVQQLIESRHCPKQSEDLNIFRALLYCDECGHRLSMATKAYKGRDVRYYRCLHHYHFPEECTGTHFLRFDHIYQIVFDDIQRVAELLMQRMDHLIAMLGREDNGRQEQLAKRTSQLESRLSAINLIIKRLYEDFAAGRTTCQNYNRLLDEYQQEQESIESEMRTISSEASGQRDIESEYQKLQEVIRRHLDIQELKPHILNELIDKIHVGQREKLDGQWVQDIRIEYCFAAEIPEI